MAVSGEEKRAALFVVTLLILGAGIRFVAYDPVAPGDVVFNLASRDARAQQDSLAAQSQRLVTPLRRGEKIDVDRASLTELTRLRGIGPALAARIVEDRDERGAFGSLENLERVSGIGPRLVEGLGPHVEFSGAARSLPQSASRHTTLSLNSATADELSALPGIGPAKAAAIVEYRRRIGRFSSVDGLAQVSGIGPKTIERVRHLVRVP